MSGALESYFTRVCSGLTRKLMFDKAGENPLAHYKRLYITTVKSFTTLAPMAKKNEINFKVKDKKRSLANVETFVGA